MKPKHQRLTLALLGVARGGRGGAAGAVGAEGSGRVLLRAFRRRRRDLPLGRAVRLGGMVEKGSVARAADGVTVRFVVTDGKATTPVTFTGIVPDLFREGSGVVAEGQFQPDGSFVATNLLAKHDEKYMPPEIAGKMHETKSLKQ